MFLGKQGQLSFRPASCVRESLCLCALCVESLSFQRLSSTIPAIFIFSPTVGAVGSTAQHSCNTPHTPRRTSSAAWAPHTQSQTNAPPAAPNTPPQSSTNHPYRTRPTALSIPLRILRTWDYVRSDRTLRQPGVSAEPPAPACRARFAQSPTRTAAPPQIPTPTAPPRSTATLLRSLHQHETPTTPATTRTTAQRIPPPPAATPLSPPNSPRDRRSPERRHFLPASLSQPLCPS